MARPIVAQRITPGAMAGLEPRLIAGELLRGSAARRGSGRHTASAGQHTWERTTGGRRAPRPARTLILRAVPHPIAPLSGTSPARGYHPGFSGGSNAYGRGQAGGARDEPHLPASHPAP